MRPVFVYHAFLSVLACPVASPTLGQEVESPTDVVRETIDHVFRLLEDDTLKDPAAHKTRRGMLEEVIAQRFDYEEMSRRALAARWRTLTDSERRTFVGLFKAFLSDRYADQIEGYSGEQVTYLGERIQNGFAEVRTKLKATKVEIAIDYRLHSKSGRWLAYDIIIDGVGLVRNYRSQFTKIIQDDSYEELLRKLQERTLIEGKTSGIQR